MKKRFSFVLVVILISLLFFVSCKSEPKHVHEFKEVVKTAATCTVAGAKEWKCECGEVEKTEEIPALGHSLKAVEGKAATCTEAGYTAYKKCERDKCGHIEGKDEIPAGHDYTGTCKDGHTICKGCNVAKPGQIVTGAVKVEKASDWVKTDNGYTIKGKASCGCDLIGTSATVDSVGPAGGYVIYDCDADNDSGNADGLVSSECGWRYIEAAPGDLGKVGDAYSFDSSAKGYTFVTEKYGYLMNGDETAALFLSGTNTKDDTTKTGVGEGKQNTLKVYEKFKENKVYGQFLPKEGQVENPTVITEYAVKTIREATVNGFNDWYIPSEDEAKLIVEKEDLLKLEVSTSYNYWTSSQGDFLRTMKAILCGDGNIYNYQSAFKFRIRPIRYF